MMVVQQTFRRLSAADRCGALVVGIRKTKSRSRARRTKRLRRNHRLTERNGQGAPTSSDERQMRWARRLHKSALCHSTCGNHHEWERVESRA